MSTIWRTHTHTQTHKTSTVTFVHALRTNTTYEHTIIFLCRRAFVHHMRWWKVNLISVLGLAFWTQQHTCISIVTRKTSRICGDNGRFASMQELSQNHASCWWWGIGWGCLPIVRPEKKSWHDHKWFCAVWKTQHSFISSFILKSLWCSKWAGVL